MSGSGWRDRIIQVIWPLLSAGQARSQTEFARLWRELGALKERLLVLQPGGTRPSVPPFPVPPAGSSITLVAKGPVNRGDPVMGVAGFPDQVALLTEDEVGVTNYRGWAVNSAGDGGSVEVWFQGPCSLFVGLGTNPAPPDTLELYVYGPYPPVPASGIPPDFFYRRCGEVVDGTTLLLSKGDKVKNPP